MEVTTTNRSQPFVCPHALQTNTLMTYWTYATIVTDHARHAQDPHPIFAPRVLIPTSAMPASTSVCKHAGLVNSRTWQPWPAMVSLSPLWMSLSLFLPLACSSTCLQCSSTDTCTSCDTTGSTPFFYNNTCVATCSGAYYGKISDYTCDSCHISCGTCSGPSATECITCASGLFNDSQSNVCSNGCPTKTFADLTAMQCSGIQFLDLTLTKALLHSLWCLMRRLLLCSKLHNMRNLLFQLWTNGHEFLQLFECLPCRILPGRRSVHKLWFYLHNLQGQWTKQLLDVHLTKSLLSSYLHMHTRMPRWGIQRYRSRIVLSVHRPLQYLRDLRLDVSQLPDS